MNELIVISQSEIGHGTVETVNARDLHAFLESKQEFTTWISSRINRWGFVRNVDYVVFDSFIKNLTGGRPTKDYFLTLDMAKELSMVERNDKGKEARQYFIDCEKRANQPSNTVLDLNDPGQLRGLLSNYAERTEIAEAEVKRLSFENEELNEDSKALAIISMADGEMCLRDAAKTLQQPQKKFFQFLQTSGWTYKQSGKGPHKAYSSKLNAEYLHHREHTIHRSDGSEQIATQCVVTAKGLAKLAELFSKAA